MASENFGPFVNSRASIVPSGAELVPCSVSSVTKQATTQSIANLGVPTYQGSRYHQAAATAQPIANNTSTVINFDTKDWDTGNFVTTGSAWKFTAVTPGKYRLSATAFFNSAAWPAGAVARMDCYKNGSLSSSLYYRAMEFLTTDYVVMQGGDTFLLAAADTLTVEVIHSQGGTVNLFGYVNGNFISIDFLGR